MNEECREFKWKVAEGVVYPYFMLYVLYYFEEWIHYGTGAIMSGHIAPEIYFLAVVPIGIILGVSLNVAGLRIHNTEPRSENSHLAPGQIIIFLSILCLYLTANSDAPLKTVCMTSRKGLVVKNMKR